MYILDIWLHVGEFQYYLPTSIRISSSKKIIEWKYWRVCFQFCILYLKATVRLLGSEPRIAPHMRVAMSRNLKLSSWQWWRSWWWLCWWWCRWLWWWLWGWWSWLWWWVRSVQSVLPPASARGLPPPPHTWQRPLQTLVGLKIINIRAPFSQPREHFKEISFGTFQK